MLNSAIYLYQSQENLRGKNALLCRRMVSEADRNTLLRPPDTAAVLKDPTDEEEAADVLESSLDTGIVFTCRKNSVLRTALNTWKCSTRQCPFDLIRPPSLEAMIRCLKKEKTYEALEFHCDFEHQVNTYNIGTLAGCEAHLTGLGNGCYLMHLFEPSTLSKKKGGTDEQYEQLLKAVRDGRLALEKAINPEYAYGYGWWTGSFYRASGTQYRFGSKYLHFEDGLPKENTSFEDFMEKGKLGLDLLQVPEWINKPNERMLTGHFGGQYMAPHVDNDTASTIVTRGLGDSAYFELHIDKDRYYNTGKDSDPDTADAPETVTYRDLKLRKAWAEYRMGTLDADLAGYAAEKKTILEFRPKRGAASMVLRWKNHHGSIMFMIGKHTQDIFKHAVTPDRFRIGQILRHVRAEDAVGPVDDGEIGKTVREFVSRLSESSQEKMKVVKCWSEKAVREAE